MAASGAPNTSLSFIIAVAASVVVFCRCCYQKREFPIDYYVETKVDIMLFLRRQFESEAITDPFQHGNLQVFNVIDLCTIQVRNLCGNCS